MYERWAENIRILYSPVFLRAVTCKYFTYMWKKLHQIAYNLASLALMKSMYTRSFEHLNMVGVRATRVSQLEKDRFVVKYLLLEGKKLCHIFQRLHKKFFF